MKIIDFHTRGDTCMNIGAGAREPFDKLIAFYSEKFMIEYNVEAAGMVVPVMGLLRHRQQKTILGFGTGKEGPEAAEYIFFLSLESFGMDEMESVKELIEYAEKEYVKKGRDHAFSFLSAVVLADKIEKDAANALKRYTLRRDYGRDGWILARAAAFDRDGGAVCNKDGSDLKKLIQKIIF